MLRKRHLVILCNLLLLSCPALLTRQVIFEAVPCQVGPPGHTWTTLISVRPRNNTWTARLYIEDSQDTPCSPLYCLLLQGQGNHTDLKLFSGQCEEDQLINKTKWARSQPHSSWVNISVAGMEKTVNFSLMSQHSAPSLASEMKDIPSRIWLQTDERSVMQCQDGCSAYSEHDLTKKLQLMRITNSSSFKIYPRPSFKSLLFRPTLVNAISDVKGFTPPDEKQFNASVITPGKWHEIQVQIIDKDYQVKVDDHQVFDFSSKLGDQALGEVKIFMDGGAYWTPDCQLELNLTMNSVTDKDCNQTPQIPQNQNVLTVVLVLTVVSVVGGVVDLILIFRLQ